MPTLLGIKDGTRDSDTELRKKDKILYVGRKFSVTYIVLSDTIDDTEDDILATAGIPGLLSYLNGAYCQGYSCEEKQTVAHPVTLAAAILWEVTADFDSDLDITQDKDKEPPDRTPSVRWGGETEKEILEKDPITGETIQTDAGEPILVEVPIILPVLEVKRYEYYPFDPDVILAFVHHTNATTFWGAPPGSALMLPVETDEENLQVERNGKKVTEKFVSATYRIKFKIKPGLDEPWKLRLLHHGHKYRPEPDEEPVAATDKHNNPITVNLKNGDGTKLAHDADPEFKEFNRFPKAEFNALSLGPF